MRKNSDFLNSSLRLFPILPVIASPITSLRPAVLLDTLLYLYIKLIIKD